MLVFKWPMSWIKKPGPAGVAVSGVVLLLFMTFSEKILVQTASGKMILRQQARLLPVPSPLYPGERVRVRGGA